MMRRKFIYMTSVFVLAGLLSGCGESLPELSEEDYGVVAEYAAGELMKYNQLNKGKIVSDQAIEEQLAKEEQFRKNTEEYLEKVKKEDEEKQEKKEKKKSSDSGSSSTGMTENVEIASFVGASPLQIQYTGMEVGDSYPSGGAEEFYFSMDASEGKKLVVLKFDISNPSGEDVNVNMLESGTGFYVSFGEEKTVSILATMLPNDLATLNTTMAPGSSEEGVLVLELDEASAANAENGYISLLMRRAGETGRATLR